MLLTVFLSFLIFRDFASREIWGSLMMPLLSKKAINSVLTSAFCRQLFWSQGSRWTLHHIPVLIVNQTGSTRSHLPWCFPEAMDPDHKWKRSFHLFCFLLVCEFVWHKSGTDLPLTKSPWTMVCAMSLLMRNSSSINLRISRWSCGSISSIISGVLLANGRPKMWLILYHFLPFAKCLNHL